MERGKSSKKRGNYKNRKPDGAQSRNKNSNWRSSGTTKTFSNDTESEDKEYISRRSLQQPDSRLADLDGIWQETNTGQDFQILAEAPISAHGHFVFKSEKNWTLDASDYDDFFSIDVKNLATIVECIPYNRYVRVDEKYFTDDELTDINNTAEKGRKDYDRMLEALRKQNPEYDSCATTRTEIDTKIMKSSSEESFSFDENEREDQGSKSIEEDLDFLLSLKEPVRTCPVNVTSTNKNSYEESKTKNVPVAKKSIDLEKWLDLVLED